MGTQKLLLPLGGVPVIARVVDQVLASRVERIVVVVGADAAGVKAALDGRGVTFAVNPDPEGDMLSSVRCGLRAMPGGWRGALVVLGDQPALRAGLIDRMIAAVEGGGRGIIVPVHAGRRGHPLLFAARHAAEVMNDFDAVGLRGLAQRHADDVLELPCDDEGVLSDMDVPEDYRRELERRRG